MKKQKLLKLADFLEKLKPRKLDMELIADLHGAAEMNPHECKSAACAMGWTPAVFPREVRRVDCAQKVQILKLDRDAGAFRY
jgi:hypothetical protein